MLLVFTIAVCGWPMLALTAQVLLELRPGDSRLGSGLSERAFPGFSQPVFLSEVPVITNADIVYARAITTTTSDAPAVVITLNKMAANKFCGLTRGSIGKLMSIFVDGKLVNVVTIREKMCGGILTITGNFSAEEAKRFVAAFPDGPADAP